MGQPNILTIHGDNTAKSPMVESRMKLADSTSRSGHSLGPTPDSIATSTSDTGPGGTTAALAEVIICSGFPTQLTLALILNGIGLQAVASDDQLSFTYVVTLSLVDAAFIVGLVVYFLHTHGESLGDLINGARPLSRETALGILLIPILVLVAIGGLLLIRTMAPSLQNVPENPLESMLDTPPRALLFGLVVVIAGGVREELQRAFILRRFEQHLGGGWLGLAVFSVAFGLGHNIQGWDVALVTGALGAVWGALYLIRRSIIASMVSHAGFNLVEIILVVTTVQAM